MGAPDIFLKPYNPHDHEGRVGRSWEEADIFNPDRCIERGVTKPDAPTYSIVLPPPNRTGTLHIGHAVMLALEDILVRFNRMRGMRTLWIPGTDHAAIATESKVESLIYKKEKKTRHDLGREKFLKRVTAFADDSHETIVKQIKRMGASLDWSREAYTLDEARSRAVREAFTRMYKAGLIYRGSRIVNWDPKLKTNVSDEEIERVEETAPLYYLTYGPFTIATARPETKFGDKYVVIHPDDERYKAFKHGETLTLEWINGEITATVIKDSAIDMAFGTGVMTITPAHDATDYEIAERHHLDMAPVIDADGKLLPIAGEFAGMHIKKARPAIVEKLRAKGLLARVDESYRHSIATNSRGGGIIEPQIREQWFVNVNAPFKLERSNIRDLPAGTETTLKRLMRHVVESGQVTIMPREFEKIYFHWIEHLRDWCVSRQIWFGHQVPVWYRGREMHVGVEPPKGAGFVQDLDTLDTWFSSSLWTIATMGWPERAATANAGMTGPDHDFANYHPTTVLETGYDILFFWVARMILMTGFLVGDVPFRTVYLHGLVRDSMGRKMSKSLGNVIDPLEVIEQYGADATRLSLVIGSGPGSDTRMSIDKARAHKKFANKLWNVSRFILEHAEAVPSAEPAFTDVDRAHLESVRELAREITADVESFRFHLAAEKLYHFVWHTLADDIIESYKPRLKGDDANDRGAAAWTLNALLKDSLKLLHPFMPFITEAIWEHVPIRDRELLAVSPWPRANTS